jgi:hypothetical protein
VIGFCEGKNWPYRQKPTLWKNDAAIELEEYGDFWLEVIDLNESDQIVGTGRYSMGFPTRRIGLRWDDAVLTMIEHPDNPLTFVDGVAMAEDGTGLIWSGQNYWMHLDSLSSHVVVPPPFYTLQPFAMNDSLHVVGRLEKQVGEGRTYSAFVFRDGYQYDLTCLGLFPAGWTNTTATGINNSGTIVGYGWQGGRMRFFLLTPSGANDVTDPELPQLVPTEFRLSQNYPNPFNPSTVIRYALPQEVDVHLEVFSILGQRVRTLVDGRQRAGEYEVQLEGSSLASGVYFYRLRAGSFVQMQKMILMK